MKKVNIYPNATKPDQIEPISPEIDDISTLLSTTSTLIPNKNNLRGGIVPEITKVIKTDHEGKHSDPPQNIQTRNNRTKTMKIQIQHFLMRLGKL